MRLCLMLLGALLWLCSGCEAARIMGPSSSAMRQALWWRRPGLLERRESRAGPSSLSGPAVAVAKGSSSPTASAKAKAGNPEAPGEVAHTGDAGSSKAQQSVRSPRGARQYDVPQIECPSAEDGMERFACPSPDRMGRYRCIDDHVLCDGFIDCPQGEDEDRMSCMFYKTTKAHLDVLADALLRWARGRY
ncbi:uncharacterized protein LOC119460630 [Dermacentor silvarum]|uniref:uncharacterized protein LOC119460630 n=1 Tax=Dermacentor silvarum TaxID=543639 RepID=UPI00189A3E18|nr:uncharacterized protein LOC119460630 [Dermacentor silvarum]